MRRTSTLQEDDRAVSEVLGYVFIFALVVGSIGLLYVSGIGSLEGIRQSEQANNAERAFVSLAESFSAMLRGEAPARAGEIRVGGGTVAVSDGPTMSLSVEGEETAEFSYDLGALTYNISDQTVWYEAGAVFRQGASGGSVMARSPPFRCTPGERVIVTVVRLEPAGTASVSTQSSLLIAGERTENRLVYPRGSSSQTADRTVAISLSSANSDAWNTYLTEQGWTQNESRFECTAPRVVVREVVVRTRLLN